MYVSVTDLMRHMLRKSTVISIKAQLTDQNALLYKLGKRRWKSVLVLPKLDANGDDLPLQTESEASNISITRIAWVTESFNRIFTFFKLSQ